MTHERVQITRRRLGYIWQSSGCASRKSGRPSVSLMPLGIFLPRYGTLYDHDVPGSPIRISSPLMLIEVSRMYVQ